MSQKKSPIGQKKGFDVCDGGTLVIRLSPDNTLFLTRGEVGRLLQLLQRGVSSDPLVAHLDWDEVARLVAELQALLVDSPSHHDWAKEGF